MILESFSNRNGSVILILTTLVRQRQEEEAQYFIGDILSD